MITALISLVSALAVALVALFLKSKQARTSDAKTEIREAQVDIETDARKAEAAADAVEDAALEEAELEHAEAVRAIESEEAKIDAAADAGAAAVVAEWKEYLDEARR
jgi:hypothetical protein